MALSNEQWELEKRRLNEVHSLVLLNIEKLEERVSSSISRIRASNKAMWKEGKSYHYDFDDVVENLSLLDGVYSDMMRHENIIAQLRKMYILKKSAYFGRLDFREDGNDETEKIYIGTSTLENSKSELLIYDWRAAISSMFYECERGRASFESPAGLIEGLLTLKRQYRILESEIESMFDSSIIIEDEILQSILSESKNDRMATIVSSIQKEQNRAIRDETHRIVYVDGPAGSGKTSIALHRAAWLLYRYREKISARNIIVYSPNEIFNDYISNVLPELGEENMKMSTFMRLALSYLSSSHRFEDNYSQMEAILSDPDEKRRETLVLKGSREFAELIREYVGGLGKAGYDIFDISANGNVLAEKHELIQLFYDDYGMHKISTRLEKLSTLLENRLVYVTRKIRKNYVEEAKRDLSEGKKVAYTARNTIEELRHLSYRLTHPDIAVLYGDFLDKSGYSSTADDYRKRLESNYIRYEDMAPMMYLRLMLGYTRDFKEIKHLIIDEVQDYSYMEMLVFFTLFDKVQMTLLGDANQAINHITDSNDLKESVAGDYHTVKLEKSYRSTRQIASFCNKLIEKNLNYEYVDRNGPLPVVIETDDIAEEIKSCIKRTTRDNASVAVITKTAVEAQRIHSNLDDEGIILIKKTDADFSRGVVITPSYLAKGLEFDSVIVVSTENAEFEGDDSRKLFYTCCSRALHELTVIFTENAPYGCNDF